jgi:iron complex transport system substrate-binding protein
MTGVRIVSLLPSATEIVFALGLGDDLCGVTFECDFPAEARAKPVVSGTRLDVGESASAADIDAAVRTTVSDGESIYTLDAARIRELQPDLILAQDLCRVCAVPSSAVDDALAVLGCEAAVLSLDPSSLDDVIACVGQVGAATDTTVRAGALMTALRARVDRVRTLVAPRPRRCVLALEWSDPPFSGGHWVPDMVAAAGGIALLGAAGEPSRPLEWDTIAGTAADVVVFMPCGYDLDRAVREGEPLAARPELRAAAEVWAVHGDAYFSRPGPRLVDGVEILAALLHPDVAPLDLAGRAVRLRP